MQGTIFLAEITPKNVRGALMSVTPVCTLAISRSSSGSMNKVSNLSFDSLFIFVLSVFVNLQLTISCGSKLCPAD